MNLRRSIRRGLNPGVLSGIAFGPWVKLLAANRFAVDPVYWPRAVAISIVAAVNSVAGGLERRRYAHRWSSTSIEPPLIVLGLGRSGTTLLHHLLCRDSRFAWVSLFESRFPRVMLSTPALVSGLLSTLVDRERVQDRVQLGFDRPGEDEPALCSLAQLSPLLRIVFPRSRHDYERFRTTAGYSDAEAACWKVAVREMLQKLTWRHGRPLVLKSPSHTARIRLLLEVVPDARFVFIHRDPHDVVASMIHTEQMVSPYWQLQRPPVRDEQWYVDQCCNWMRGYLAERPLIASGRLCEVGYDELVDAPVNTLRRIYGALALSDFSAVAPTIAAFAEGMKGHRRASRGPLSPAARARITRICPEWLETWHYAPR